MTDEITPLGEIPFSLVESTYRRLSENLENEDILPEAKKRLTERFLGQLVSQVQAFYSAGPQVSYAVLDVEQMEREGESLIYSPHGEMYKGHLINLDGAYLWDPESAVPYRESWYEDEVAVMNVAKVMLYSLPEAERVRIAGEDMYKNIYVEPLTPQS